MKIIEICPVCSNPGIEVEHITVSSLLKNGKMKSISADKKYFICSNSACIVTYFLSGGYFTVDDLKTEVWFKNSGKDIPICYCSDLTRGEISAAVKNGCKTINDVQKYTKKNATGNCRTMNPLGKCCRDVFLKTIKDATEMVSREGENMSECCGSGKTRLVYACSGCADVGEIADRVARKLSKDGFGNMTCLAGIGAQLSGFIESAKGADENITIDGCPVACARKNLERIGVKPKSYILTEMGLVKGKTPVTESVVTEVSNKIKGTEEKISVDDDGCGSGCCCS